MPPRCPAASSPTRGLWPPQENHYQPPDQDACLPCDCFPHGSHSRACDVDTGQCACKPGVIGRQCNRCDNPFAEVTTLGCEGLCCPLAPLRPPRRDRLLGFRVCAWVGVSVHRTPLGFGQHSVALRADCPLGPLRTWPMTGTGVTPRLS